MSLSDQSESVRTYTIHVCPKCGAHITQSGYNPEHGEEIEAVPITVVPQVAFDEDRDG
jgi:hypothetical protein